jgi:uncharacterized membrane protein YhaH (DUF805 family)
LDSNVRAGSSPASGTNFLNNQNMNHIKKYFQFTDTISGTTYFLRNLIVSIFSFLAGTGMGVAMIQNNIPIMLVSVVFFVFVYWFSMTTIYKRFNALTPKNASVYTVGLLSIQLFSQITPIPYRYALTIVLVVVAIFLILSNSNLENHKG